MSAAGVLHPPRLIEATQRLERRVLFETRRHTEKELLAAPVLRIANESETQTRVRDVSDNLLGGFSRELREMWSLPKELAHVWCLDPGKRKSKGRIGIQTDDRLTCQLLGLDTERIRDFTDSRRKWL